MHLNCRNSNAAGDRKVLKSFALGKATACMSLHYRSKPLQATPQLLYARNESEFTSYDLTRKECSSPPVCSRWALVVDSPPAKCHHWGPVYPKLAIARLTLRSGRQSGTLNNSALLDDTLHEVLVVVVLPLWCASLRCP